MFSKYPKTLQNLIYSLKKLPGVGNKTAERFAFQLLKWKKEQLEELGFLLGKVKTEIHYCPICGCLMTENSCEYCDLKLRNSEQLCIVSSQKDLFSIESTKSFKGLYHVIDHLLSPLDGFGSEHLHLEKLTERILLLKIKEVIIALDSTLEGDATALFLKEKFQTLGVIKISRLAFGLPLGSSLEFVDEGTLSRALTGRQVF